MIAAAWITLFAPAAAVVLLALAGNRGSGRFAGLVATASVLVSFIASLVVLIKLLGFEPSDREHYSTLWTWLSAGSFHVGFQIVVDPLSVFMMLVVSGVGFLILAYATGYLRGDDEERRYHAYKALFVFSMLLLVQGGNLLLLLAGWGMVGLSSYLLINYWHQRRSAVQAGKKAFIMNAFGDATFVLALFLIVQKTGSLDFTTVFTKAPQVIDKSSTVAVLIALGLLGGAVAKSAQIPLQTWLPDAMEGPTPVSALIHAATMVTAGVYLIARTNVLFELAPAILHLAAVLGGITLLVAGLIAFVQTDIKRVIAYSTMSQIGYMFLAAGIGAYGASMFHLMTHAFFKALLFMCAGVVIHAISNEQDIRKMGGLGRDLPRTTQAFLIGTLSLIGIPPLAGFFSKDGILANALDAGALGIVLFVMGIIGAFLTAVYAMRLLFIVFRGKRSDYAEQHFDPGSRDAHHGWSAYHEGPLAMMWPLLPLAFLSIFGGWLQVPGGWSAVTTFIDPVAPSLTEPSRWMEALASILAVGLALVGIWIAWRIWAQRPELAERVRARVPRTARALEHKLYFDEAYDAVFYEPASRFAVWLDRHVEAPLLGSVGVTADSVRGVGRKLAALQTGALRVYAILIAASAAVIILVFIAVR